MLECTICARGEEVANVVNELLDKKTILKDISAQTGIHKNTIWRHSKGSCRFSFSKFKAAKIKGRTAPIGGRTIVQWPNSTFTHYGEKLQTSDLLPTDRLIIVSYENLGIHNFKNPAALLTENLRDEAIAEHKARFGEPVTLPEPEPVTEPS